VKLLIAFIVLALAACACPVKVLADGFAQASALRMTLAAPAVVDGPNIQLRQGWYMPDANRMETGAAAYGVASRGIILGFDVYSGLAYTPNRGSGSAAAGLVGVIIPLE